MIDYNTKLAKFVKLLEENTKSPTVSIKVENGRKFDKVYRADVRANDEHKTAWYMVNNTTGEIFGVKSWTQVNLRRLFGTLDTISEWNWAYSPAIPLPKTAAEQQHNAREEMYAKKYKPRGRPKKQPVPVNV